MSFQNWHKEFDVFWLENSKVAKVYILMGCSWPKHITFELKKCRRVIFHDTKKWRKTWRKNDLQLEKWYDKFDKSSPEHTEVWKRGLSLGPFTQSRHCLDFKLTGELYVMKMKNDAKFEKELTCQFKIDIRNLVNFDPSTQKPQKFSH